LKRTQYPIYKDTGIDWVPIIPDHWDVKRLKFIANIQFSGVDKKSNDDEPEVQLCNYVDVYKNETIDSSIEFMKATASQREINKFRLEIGDILATKDSESPYDIAVPAIVSENYDNVLCGYHLAQVKPYKNIVYPAYLFRVFQEKGFNTQFVKNANGITRFGVGTDVFGSALVSLPTLDEQKVIADFLDQKTSQIDNLIVQKKILLKLLEEKRIALITQAVTKGLCAEVKMKPSGVDWLGNVPENWKVLKIKRLSIVKRGASPRPIDEPSYFDEEGEYSWVRIADVTASDRYLETTTQKMSDLGKFLSVPLEPGELFISICATVGKPIITKIKCCIHDGFVYFPHLKENRDFFYYLFVSGQLYLGLGKMGTQLNLNTETVGNITIALPSLREQQEIVSFIETEICKITNLSNEIIHAIESLNEYRMTLITSAVTGRIDVRDFLQEQENEEIHRNSF
jgi:type I restriction enzyme, S subunit